MNILQVAAFPFPSSQGSQVYVRGMCRALARRGHKVRLLCYGHGEGKLDPEYSIIRIPKLPGYHNMRAGPDLVKPFLDLMMAFKLSRLQGDIMHAHNYEAPIACALAQLKNSIPMVYSAHNTMSQELPSYFDGLLMKKISRKIGIVLDKTVPRTADHAVAIRASTVQKLEKLGCKNVSLVPPGIDPNDVRPCRPADLPPGPWVIYAGNPDKYQDLDVLYAAMRKMPTVGLLMVSSADLGDLKNLGLPKLHCVRTSDFNVVRSYVAAADIAAIPRVVCSGFPIKLLNFLGMGLPVVAASGGVDSMPGVIRVANHSPDAMSKVISELLDAPDRLERLGISGKNHVLENCTWNQRAKDLENIYNQAIAF